MAKHIDTDIMAILRLFEIAGELSSKKAIHDIKAYDERMLSRLVAFTFERQRYYLIFDTSAADDEALVLEHIRQDAPDIKGSLVRNPLNKTKAYGMPYRGKDVYLFAVANSKQRLDLELTTRYPEYSRSTIQKYIKAGHVTVNGEIIHQPKADVSALDDIALTPPVSESHEKETLPIVYLNDHVIVVNKPAGILTHSKGVMNQEFTVADFFRRYTSFGLETNRPGIIHRLDRDTSGIIIGARDAETAALLKKQFADRSVSKQYIAVTSSIPKQDQAVIDLPIGRSPSAPSTFKVDASGKPAQTTFTVLDQNDHEALVRLQPKTGRTHQLRVHLQYIGAPIKGDRVYGGEKADRLYLHAHQLELTIPEGKRTTFTAEVPPEFTKHFSYKGEW